MRVVYTLFCAGTAYHVDSNDVVAQLHRQTLSLKGFLNGPGSGRDYQPEGTRTIGGLLGGTGVDANVGTALDMVRKYATVDRMVLNMCGWSRGAVTMFKIANAISRETDLKDKVTCNLFAIDPVPGGSSINNHMWRDIDNSPNIGMANIVIAQHERRYIMRPLVPRASSPYIDIDIMPGDHGTVAEVVGHNPEAGTLVKHMALGFLRRRGTNLTGDGLLDDIAVLGKYSRIIQRFEEYARYDSDGGKRYDWRVYKGARALQDHRREVVATMVPTVGLRFWINEHHRETFLRVFPSLGSELDKPAGIAFKGAARWNSDLDRLMAANDVALGQTVLFYAGHLLRAL